MIFIEEIFKSFWYLERDSNSHDRSRGILSPLCLPFHHPGLCISILGNYISCLFFIKDTGTVYPTRFASGVSLRRSTISPSQAYSLSIIVKKIETQDRLWCKSSYNFLYWPWKFSTKIRMFDAYSNLPWRKNKAYFFIFSIN